MNKLNGFRATHKNKWRFIQYNILTIQELAQLEFYADIVDFDPRHSKYGTFVEDFTEFALIFNCSEGTVRNRHNKLLKLGFIEATVEMHRYKLTCHERFGCTANARWKGKALEYEKREKDQSIEIVLQSFGINFQTIKEKVQPVVKIKRIKSVSTIHSDSIVLGSSKVDSMPSKSDEEYQKFLNNVAPTEMTIEDLKWIDLNVRENPNVPS